MRKFLSFIPIVFFLLLLYSESMAQCTVPGWASLNGGVTGGGSATPTVVTNYNELKAALTSLTVKVVHVSGTIVIPSGGKIFVQDQSSKTIYGLPGSKLVSNDLTKDGSGILYIKRCSNILFRNMTLEGPGAYDTDGWDNMTIDNSTNVWVDHCEFQDGMDGNFDIKNAADYISVTWCKFIYNKAPIPGGPGGSNDHRFSDLFGSGDAVTTDRGKLRVTMQNCWWAQGCKARMPRVRYGKVHIVNSLFNSTVAAQCVMAGFESDLLVERNVFENVKSPIDKMDGTFTAITTRGNIFTNTVGDTTGRGTAFTPPYILQAIPAADVKSKVMAGAGATLTSPSCNTTTTYTLSTAATPASSGTVAGAGTYNAGTVVTVTATPATGYTFTGWSGAATGTSPSVSVTMDASKSVTANFQAQASTYILSTTASPTAGGTVTGAGTYNAGTSVTLTATPATGYTFTGWSGAATGTSPSVSVTMDANKSVTANFQAQASTYILSTTASPTAGGTVTGAGTYNAGTAVTLTATPATGYTFTGWSGAATGTSPSVSVTMDANKSVTANFQAQVSTYILNATASPTAGGTVTGAGSYSAGATATLTASAATGYTFAGWSGDASGTSASISITMSSNKSVTANFTAQSSGGTSTIRIEDTALTSGGLCSYEGAIVSNTGASNGKAINLSNSAGKGIDWKVNVPSAGSYTLTWRYVNSSSSNAYTMALIVNGTTVNNALAVARTSGTVFSTVAETVVLKAGINAIRVQAVSSAATADIDWLEVTGNTPATADCASVASSSARSIGDESESTTLKEKTVSISPNPAKDKVIITIVLAENEQATIMVYNSEGNLVDKFSSGKAIKAGVQQIPYTVSNKRSGIYNIVVVGSKGNKSTYKLVIE